MKGPVCILALFLLLGCQINNLVGPTLVNPNDPIALFTVDGVGPVTVNEETKKIDVLLPSGFNQDSLRINYQLGRPLTGRTGVPASGASVNFQGQPPVMVCIRTFTGVGCERLYSVRVRYTDPLKAVVYDPTGLERTINSPTLYQNILLLLTNQGTLISGQRRFRLQFRNRETRSTYVVDNRDY